MTTLPLMEPLPKPHSLTETFNRLVTMANHKSISVQIVCHELAQKGYAPILIMLALPLCFPMIPGLSTPFGLLIAFLGLRLALGKEPWWPHWIWKHELPYTTLVKIRNKTEKILLIIQRFVRPRFSFLQHPIMRRIHGCNIIALGLLLALPLPIPLTNILSAWPLLFFGLAFLEEDGLMIIIGYILSLVCYAFYFYLFYFGWEGIEKIFF